MRSSLLLQELFSVFGSENRILLYTDSKSSKNLPEKLNKQKLTKTKKQTETNKIIKNKQKLPKTNKNE